jgi:hypothetical protein
VEISVAVMISQSCGNEDIAVHMRVEVKADSARLPTDRHRLPEATDEAEKKKKKTRHFFYHRPALPSKQWIGCDLIAHPDPPAADM